MRLQLAAVDLILDLLDFAVHLYAEYGANHKHREDYTDNTERISGCITHSHLLRHAVGSGVDLKYGLLCGTKSGSVGDGSRHNAHKCGYRSVSVDEEDCQHYSHVEHYHKHGKTVEQHSALLERREESGAYL